MKLEILPQKLEMQSHKKEENPHVILVSRSLLKLASLDNFAEDDAMIHMHLPILFIFMNSV